MEKQALHQSVTKDLQSLAELNEAVKELLDQNHIPTREQYVIRLVLEELFTNVVKFTRSAPYSDAVDCRIELEDGSICLSLKYEGPPFDPHDAPIPDIELPLEERRLGGLGLHLVRNMVDQLEYTRVSDTIRLDVRVDIQPSQDHPSERPSSMTFVTD